MFEHVAQRNRCSPPPLAPPAAAATAARNYQSVGCAPEGQARSPGGEAAPLLPSNAARAEADARRTRLGHDELCAIAGWSDCSGLRTMAQLNVALRRATLAPGALRRALVRQGHLPAALPRGLPSEMQGQLMRQLYAEDALARRAPEGSRSPYLFVPAGCTADKHDAWFGGDVLVCADVSAPERRVRWIDMGVATPTWRTLPLPAFRTVEGLIGNRWLCTADVARGRTYFTYLEHRAVYCETSYPSAAKTLRIIRGEPGFCWLLRLCDAELHLDVLDLSPPDDAPRWRTFVLPKRPFAGTSSYISPSGNVLLLCGTHTSTALEARSGAVQTLPAAPEANEDGAVAFSRGEGTVAFWRAASFRVRLVDRLTGQSLATPSFASPGRLAPSGTWGTPPGEWQLCAVVDGIFLCARAVGEGWRWQRFDWTGAPLGPAWHAHGRPSRPVQFDGTHAIVAFAAPAGEGTAPGAGPWIVGLGEGEGFARRLPTDYAFDLQQARHGAHHWLLGTPLPPRNGARAYLLVPLRAGGAEQEICGLPPHTALQVRQHHLLLVLPHRGISVVRLR